MNTEVVGVLSLPFSFLYHTLAIGLGLGPTEDEKANNRDKR